MFVNLTPIIRRGVIDNTVRGKTKLLLWCGKSDEPWCVELAGDCLQDVAGCRTEFRRPASAQRLTERELELVGLVDAKRETPPEFTIGDITLSRRAPSRKYANHLANYLYIEFFVLPSERYLIECEAFSFSISPPSRPTTPAMESAQDLLNLSTMRDHVLYCVQTYRSPGMLYKPEGMPPCKWDNTLNLAEGYMAMLPVVAEKYADRPDRGLAMGFVLNHLAYQNHAALMHEAGEACPAEHAWAVLDFMRTDEAEKTRKAMEHPLFAATVQLTSIMQHYIVAEREHYAGNLEVDSLLTRYAGMISNVLATLLLVQEDASATATAKARINALSDAAVKLKPLSQSLQPRARSKFLHGLDILLHELNIFFHTLHR